MYIDFVKRSTKWGRREKTERGRGKDAPFGYTRLQDGTSTSIANRHRYCYHYSIAEVVRELCLCASSTVVAGPGPDPVVRLLVAQ